MIQSFKLAVLRFCWMIGCFHLAKHLMKDKLQILCYHGFDIAGESTFRPRLFMTHETFAARMALLARHGFRVIELDEAAKQLQQGTLPDHAVTITIDDGFYSVLPVATPILARHQFPATLYLTTYYMEKANPIFRLVVQYMFWRTTQQTVDLRDCRWCEHERHALTGDDVRTRLAWECIHFGEQQCDEPERVRICEQLGRLLGVDYQEIVDARMLSLLTIEEARTLPAQGIDIQLHTHRHHFPADDPPFLEKELLDNRQALEDVGATPLVHFCYPSGIWEPAHWPVLENAGMATATTSDRGLNHAAVHPLALMRFLDHEEITDIEFKAELFGFMEVIRMLRARGRRLLGRREIRSAPDPRNLTPSPTLHAQHSASKV